MLRTVALLCLLTLLLGALTAPVHTHHETDNATCLICHVGPAAVAVASAARFVGPRVVAGSKLDAGQVRLAFSLARPVKTPRAPPALLLSVHL